MTLISMLIKYLPKLIPFEVLSQDGDENCVAYSKATVLLIQSRQPMLNDNII